MNRGGGGWREDLKLVALALRAALASRTVSGVGETDPGKRKSGTQTPPPNDLSLFLPTAGTRHLGAPAGSPSCDSSPLGTPGRAGEWWGRDRSITMLESTDTTNTNLHLVLEKDFRVHILSKYYYLFHESQG